MNDKYHRPQTSTTGVNAYFGTWPGDETEEELIEMMNDFDGKTGKPRNKSFKHSATHPEHLKAKQEMIDKKHRPHAVHEIEFEEAVVHKCPDCGFVFGPGTQKKEDGS